MDTYETWTFMNGTFKLYTEQVTVARFIRKKLGIEPASWYWGQNRHTGWDFVIQNSRRKYLEISLIG